VKTIRCGGDPQMLGYCSRVVAHFLLDLRQHVVCDGGKAALALPYLRKRIPGGRKVLRLDRRYGGVIDPGLRIDGVGALEPEYLESRHGPDNQDNRRNQEGQCALPPFQHSVLAQTLVDFFKDNGHAAQGPKNEKKGTGRWCNLTRCPCPGY